MRDKEHAASFRADNGLNLNGLALPRTDSDSRANPDSDSRTAWLVRAKI